MSPRMLGRLLASLLSIGLLAATVSASPATAKPATVQDGQKGVSRVIVYKGVTPAFMAELKAAVPLDLVYTFHIIDGVAVAVRDADVGRVLTMAHAKGILAVPDPVLKADLTASTKPIKVKGSGNAWSMGYTGAGVTVGVIDSGINGVHPALNDMDDNTGTTDPKVLAFRDFVNAGGGAVAPYDDNGHGSHVSGISSGTGQGLAGDGPREFKNVGVAYESNLVGLKVLNNQGSGNGSNMIAAIQWAIDNKNNVTPPLRVLNISIGSLVPTPGSNNGNAPQSLAVDAASAAGIVTAAAAGNGTGNGIGPNAVQGNVSSPGDARTAITACSSNSADPPVFSTWDSEGPTADGRLKPDVCAPGDSISSASGTGSTYVTQGGTSMSSPHVAGVAALMLQAVPGLTPAQVKQAMQLSASHAATPDNSRGYGEVNAKAAIQYAIANFSGGTGALTNQAGPFLAIQGTNRKLTVTAAGGKAPYAHAWDLDNDGAFDDATGASATFTNTSSLATYSIGVRTTDADNTVVIRSTTVQVVASQISFSDNVENGINGWTATNNSLAPTTAAGWHRQSAYAKSPSNAWYAGNDTSKVYGPGEDVRLTRPVDLRTTAIGATGQVLMRFQASGSLEPEYDMLHVAAREAGTSSWTELASIDDTTRAAWTPVTVDLADFVGKQAEISFQWTSDDFNDAAYLQSTGPYVDDIELLTPTPQVNTDSIAPADVTDLAASVAGTSATITWTAPGDDGSTGTASAYQLRRAPVAIDSTNFDMATTVATGAPKPAGGAETATVTGLTPGTTYFFALKTVDENANVSGQSNLVSITTPADTVAPSKVTGLVASAGDAQVSLSWTAATDDLGVDHYIVKKDGSDAATVTTPAASLTGLTNGTAYSFAVAAVDGAGNVGELSDAVSVTPTAPPVVSGWTQSRGNAARTGNNGTSSAVITPKILASVAAGPTITASPVIADLDGDGTDDVVVLTDQTSTDGAIIVKAYKKSGTGLAQMWSYTVPFALAETTNGTGALAVGDLDGNGTAEVIAYTNYQVNLQGVTSNEGRMTALNGATGTLAGELLPADITIGTKAAPAIGDVDGDGKPDVVFIHQVGGAASGYYLAGASLGAGGLSKSFDTLLGAIALNASPALGELRSSHAGLEVVVAEDNSSSASKVYVCSPSGGTAGCSENVSPTTGIRGLSIADLNADGVSEIVANGRTGQSLNIIKTAPTLSVVSKADSFLWNTATLGDIDADGKADIVNVNYSEYAPTIDLNKAGDVQVRSFTGTAVTDKGTLARTPTTPGASKQSAGGGILANIAGDARPEFVFGGDDNALTAVQFAGNGAPSALWSLAVPAAIKTPIAVGDLDGDGKADLVFGTATGSLMVVGNRAPTLAVVTDKTVVEGSALAFSLAGADADADPITYSAQGMPTGAALSAGGAFSWTPTTGQAGTYPITFSVSDGGSTASRSATIEVTEPVVGDPDDVPTIIGSPAPGVLLSNTLVTVSGTTAPDAIVSVTEAGTEVGTATADGVGAWTTTITFADGAHTIRATGGSGTTISSPVTFTIDTTPPSAPDITSPTEGAVLASRAVTISGTAEADSLVSLLDGATSLGSVTASGTGAWSLARTLADGSHAVTARATDTVGNLGDASPARTFAIDTSVNVVITSVTDPIRDTNSDNVTVAGTAPVGSSVSVKLSDGTRETLTKVATVGSSGAWSLTPFNAKALANGTVTAIASATTAQGNTATTTRTATKSGAALAPTVQFVSDGFGYIGADTDPDTDTVQVTVTNNGPDASAVILAEAKDAAGNVVDLGSFTMAMGESKTMNFDAKTLTDGALSATAKSGSATGSDTVTLDRIKPVVTVNDGGIQFSGPFLSIKATGTATDATSAIRSVVVKLKSGSSVLSSNYAKRATNGKSTTWEASFSNMLTPGNYTVEAISIDEAGNTSVVNSTTIMVI